MELTDDTKLGLTLQRDQELRLYLMIGTTVITNAIIPKAEQKVIAIAGYDLESTLAEARKTNPDCLIVYKDQTILFKDLLGKIKDGVGEVKVVETKEPSKETFITGLKLVADRFVTNKRDKASLLRVLERIE